MPENPWGENTTIDGSLKMCFVSLEHTTPIDSVLFLSATMPRILKANNNSLHPSFFFFFSKIVSLTYFMENCVRQNFLSVKLLVYVFQWPRLYLTVHYWNHLKQSLDVTPAALGLEEGWCGEREGGGKGQQRLFLHSSSWSYHSIPWPWRWKTCL